MNKVITLPDWVHMISLIGCDGMEKRSEWYVPVELKDLNSDYINEHFGDLQDTAYQRGLEEGKKTTFEQVADASHAEYQRGYIDGKRFSVGESVKNAEYQRGFEDGKAVNDKGCEGCKYSDGVVQENFPCANCCNYYMNNWTKKEFVRGDVVVDEDGTRGIVVSSENNESNLLYVLFKGYRVPQSVVRKYYKKTGEHYDIDKWLDEIKEESNK